MSKQTKKENDTPEDKTQVSQISEYRLKLIMWYLVRFNVEPLSKKHDFKLGTNIEKAGSYKDVVFNHKKTIGGNERNHFTIMHCNNYTGTNKKLTFEEIFTNRSSSFDILKCYHSFMKYKNSLKKIPCSEINHAIIYMNADFDLFGPIPEKNEQWKKLKTIKGITTNVTEEEMSDWIIPLNKIGKGKGKYYRFKSDLVLSVFKSMFFVSFYYSIARKLIRCLENKKLYYLSNEDETLKQCSNFLMTEVIDKSKNILQEDFLDDDGDTTERQKLRKALYDVAEEKNINFDDIAKKKINIRKNFGEQGIQNWSEDIVEINLKEFLDKSIFATGWHDENELREFILPEIKERYKNKHDSKLVSDSLSDKIRFWINYNNFDSNQSGKKDFISFQKVKFFFQTAIPNMLLRGPVIKYNEHIERFLINFIHSDWENNIKKLWNSDKHVVFINCEEIIYTSMILCTELKNIVELDKIFYVKLSSLYEESLNSAIEHFKSESTKCLLVIESDFNEIKEWSDKKDHIIENIIDIIISENKKIIITSNQEENSKNISQIFSEQNIAFNEIHDSGKTKIKYLENLKNGLSNLPVVYKGHHAKLSDLLNIEKIMDDEILLKTIIIKSYKKIEIGNRIEEFKNSHCYVHRTFICEVNNDKNVYLISRINEKDLCEKANFVNFETQNIKLIEKHESDETENETNVFRRKVAENDSKDVFLLRKKDGMFDLLKQSRDSFENDDFKNAMDCKGKCEINLISATTGMGKSMLLTNLSREVQAQKTQNSKLWVIKIELSTMLSKLNKIEINNTNIDLETVIDFLHYGANHQDKLEKMIFKHQLQSENIVLFLDGLSEISPSYKPIVLKMIKVLENKAKIRKIWISVRPHDRIVNDIKKSFVKSCLKHYNIEPFTENDQKLCLKKFWKQSIEINEQHFKIFYSELFKPLQNKIDRVEEFPGIALHTMMIGGVFKDIFIDFQKTNEPKISEDLRKKVLQDYSASKLYKEFLGNHWKCKILALDSFFEESDLKQILTEKEVNKLEEHKKDMAKNPENDEFGIIKQIINDKPQFITRKFVDYYVAFFFVEKLWITNEKQNSQIIFKYFMEHLTNIDNRWIFNFIDSELNDESLKCTHKYDVEMKSKGDELNYVLERKWLNIAKILIDSGINMNQQRNGKTVLHLAIELGNIEHEENSILRMIIDKLKIDPGNLKTLLDTKDSNGNTPVSIVFKYGIKNDIEVMLNAFEFSHKFESVYFAIKQKDDNVHQNIKKHIIEPLFDIIQNEVDTIRSFYRQNNQDSTTEENEVLKKIINDIITGLNEKFCLVPVSPMPMSVNITNNNNNDNQQSNNN